MKLGINRELDESKSCFKNVWYMTGNEYSSADCHTV